MSICPLWLFLGESLISVQVFQIWLCICDRRDLIRFRRLEIIAHTFHHYNVDLFYLCRYEFKKKCANVKGSI